MDKVYKQILGTEFLSNLDEFTMILHFKNGEYDRLVVLDMNGQSIITINSDAIKIIALLLEPKDK